MSDKVLIALSTQTARWYAEVILRLSPAGEELRDACIKALEAPPPKEPTFDTLYVYEDRNSGEECNQEGPPQVPQVGDDVQFDRLGLPNSCFVVECIQWITQTYKNRGTIHTARVYLAWSSKP